VLILAATTDNISLTLDEGSSDIDVTASFIDRNQTTGAVGVADKEVHNITAAGTTDIVASPASTTTRQVKELTVRNAHASQNTTVHVHYDANGTLYELFAATLRVGDRLQFTEGAGFGVVYGAKGARLDDKVWGPVGPGIGIDPLRHSTQNSIAPIPGFFVPVKAGRAYNFEGVGILQGGSVTTNGCQLATRFLNATFTSVSPTSIIQSLIGNVTAGVTGSAQCSRTTEVDGVICATGTSSITEECLNIFSGYFIPAVDGQFLIGLVSETSLVNGAQMWSGWLHVWEPSL
jgi:hypothetical protein